jgi:isoquinoline 1-oxidoreductase
MTARLDRRQFLAAALTGLSLSFRIPDASGPGEAAANALFEPNAALTIAPDGIVTIHVTKAEMGQGVGTALAQIVAEELEANWGDVRIVYPSNEPKYGVMHTGGSTSIHDSFDALSRAGAAARLMLIDTASRQWGVAAADCLAERGLVLHPRSGRSISYGALVAAGPQAKTLSTEELKAIPLKKPTAYRLIGRSIPRLDIPDKVSGRATFAIDVRQPGMVYARVKYPPTRSGAKRTSVDDARARQVNGYVKTIVSDELVAVVADTYEAATEACDALAVTWDPGPYAQVSSQSILHDYGQRLRQERGERWVDVGSVNAALSRAARTATATYTMDLVTQAQLEPVSCVARYENGIFDIYTGTQTASALASALARRLAVDPSRIRIHQQYLGGSFGRRLYEMDIETEAALIAREVNRPVKIVRPREEDFGRGYPQSPVLQILQAGLDANGTVTAWEHAVIASGSPRRRAGTLDARGRDPRAIRGADHLYEIPNRTIRAIDADYGIPSGFYRTVATRYTAFAVETFLDELAHMAGHDPLSLRLSMLRNSPRLAAVLSAAAARAGWGGSLPPASGRGLAAITEPQPQWRTYTAAVVQARVDTASGRVTVERMTCAVDCGTVVNPDGVNAQVEGALIFGLSGALKEQMTITAGAFDQDNFDSYPILRMDEVPEIDVHVIPSAEYPTGVGEHAVAVVAPALSNAIFAATGARLRHLPFLPERVRHALRETGATRAR